MQVDVQLVTVVFLPGETYNVVGWLGRFRAPAVLVVLPLPANDGYPYELCPANIQIKISMVFVWRVSRQAVAIFQHQWRDRRFLKHSVYFLGRYICIKSVVRQPDVYWLQPIYF